MCIYGPPAVGKFTVATALAKLTGYKLFHNHLTADAVMALFPFGSPPFSRTLRRMRRELIEEAAREGVSLIYTYVYAAGQDDPELKDLIRRVGRHGGKVLFVKLYCAHRALHERVRHASRKRFGKIKKLATLKQAMRQYRLEATFPFAESLEIDNTALSPRKVAQIIQRHYRL